MYKNICSNNDTIEATSPFTLKLESEDRESGSTKAKMVSFYLMSFDTNLNEST